MKAVSFGRDGSERCRPGLQVEGNEEAWPQPVPGTRGGGVHHHRIFGLLPGILVNVALLVKDTTPGSQERSTDATGMARMPTPGRTA